MKVANALAYYDWAKITVVKCFLAPAPDPKLHILGSTLGLTLGLTLSSRLEGLLEQVRGQITEINSLEW